MRFTVTSYRQHARASMSYLVHDTEDVDDGQIAVFQDQALARAVAVTLSQQAEAFDTALKIVDPHRGAF